MAIGTTEAFDPNTGERIETQFNYTPVDPQDDLMRQAFERSQQAFFPPPPQPRGPTPYWENPETYYPQQPQIDPIAQAKAATAAAYKYIAFRGYQNDLKEGKSAADAFAKWGPMLVQDVSLAPTIKALAPSPAPYVFNPQTRAYESPSGQRPYFEPNTLSRMPDVAIEENIKTIDGKKFYHNPRTGSITELKSGDKPEELDVIDYRNAQSQLADANKVLLDAYSTPAARAAATNIINQASETIKGVRGKSPSAPTAPATIKKFKWNVKTGSFE